MIDEPEKKCDDLDTTMSDQAGDSAITAPEIVCSPEDHLADDDDKESIPESDRILDEIEQIRKIIKSRLSYDKSKDEAFERLYQELDELKRNKVFEECRPLFIDLILFYDRIQAATVESESPSCDVLESLQGELKEVLLRREIEPIRNTSVLFDPTTQRAVSTEDVESVELGGKVIQVLREGFAYRGKVLRAQEVVVGRHQPSATNSEPETKFCDQNKDKGKE